MIGFAGIGTEELGQGLLTKANPLRCRFIRYKGLAKHRVKTTLKGGISQGGHDKRYAKANREPWLLVTSHTFESVDAKQVVKTYAKRMQIEEDIRDTKSSRFGFSLSLSATRSTGRMAILLVIGMLSTFMCWIAAVMAHERGTAADYQARSSKFMNAISYVFLGRLQ